MIERKEKMEPQDAVRDITAKMVKLSESAYTEMPSGMQYNIYGCPPLMDKVKTTRYSIMDETRTTISSANVSDLIQFRIANTADAISPKDMYLSGSVKNMSAKGCVMEGGFKSLVRSIDLVINGNTRISLENCNLIDDVLTEYQVGSDYRARSSKFREQLPLCGHVATSYAISKAPATLATGNGEPSFASGTTLAFVIPINFPISDGEIALPIVKSPHTGIDDIRIEIRFEDANTCLINTAGATSAVGDLDLTAMSYEISNLRLVYSSLTIEDPAIKKDFYNSLSNIEYITPWWNHYSFNVYAGDTSGRFRISRPYRTARYMVLTMRYNVTIASQNARSLTQRFLNGSTDVQFQTSDKYFPDRPLDLTDIRSLYNENLRFMSKTMSRDIIGRIDTTLFSTSVPAVSSATPATANEAKYVEIKTDIIIDLEKYNEEKGIIAGSEISNGEIVFNSSAGFTVDARVDVFLVHDTLVELTLLDASRPISIKSYWTERK